MMAQRDSACRAHDLAREVTMRVLLVTMALAAAAFAGKPTTMPAYYDGKLFTINFTELPAGGETATHDHNMSTNVIYQCDACSFGFVSVLDAIQGDGFNPIWEEQQITFNDGFTPHQFFSDNEILDAQAAGEITITDTDEMYICAVLGPKKK
jgi:hypothetical protein